MLSTTLKLSAPLIGAQLALISLSFIDALTFTQFGVQGLVGGALAVTVFTLINIVCTGIVSVIGNEVSYFHGAQSDKGIRQSVHSGFIIAIGLGTLAALLILCAPALFYAFDLSPSAINYSKDYLYYASIGIIPSLIFTCLRFLVTGLSRPGPIIVIASLAVLIKIILNAGIVLIAHYLSSVDSATFGLAACGISSVIVYSFMAFALWRWCSQDATVSKYLDIPALDFEVIKNIKKTLSLGLPVGAMLGIESGLFTGVTFIIGLLSDEALAASYIAIQFIYFSTMLMTGLSQAVAVQVETAAGHYNLNQLLNARHLTHQALFIGFIFTTGLGIAFVLLWPSMANIFLSSNENATNNINDSVLTFLSISGCFLWADAVRNISTGALKGLKDTKSVLGIGFAGYWVIGFSSIWLLGFYIDLTPPHIWWGLGAAFIATAVLLTARFEFVIHNRLTTLRPTPHPTKTDASQRMIPNAFSSKLLTPYSLERTN